MRGAEEVLHDLYIRIVVLENEYTRFLFLNIDSGPSPDAEIKEEISEKFQIPTGHMVAVWTHNHSAGIKWSNDPAMVKEEKYQPDTALEKEKAISTYVVTGSLRMDTGCRHPISKGLQIKHSPL